MGYLKERDPSPGDQEAGHFDEVSLPLPGLSAPLQPGELFFDLRLDGHPQHKARHRSRIARPKKGKPFIHNYPDPDTAAFEETLAEVAAIRMRMLKRKLSSAPICLLVIADKAVPKSWTIAERTAALEGRILPTSKPDWDNHGKITDALTGIVWVDDSQVVDARVMKRYSARPALLIEVWEFVSPK